MIRSVSSLAAVCPAFFRFGVVGIVGFAIDAGVLLLLLKSTSLHSLTARLMSFSLAVLSTFELNRRWTFRNANLRYLRQLSAYLSVQCVGFLSNVAIYTALYALLPAPYNAPLFCLAVASGTALFFNFAGARLVVFRRRPRADRV